MRELNYKFVGLQNYEPVQTSIRAVFNKAFVFHNTYFDIAVDEAVSNATRYAVKGMSEAEVYIRIRISENDITVRVSSDTQPFDSRNYQMQLQELANLPKYSRMEWGDYTGLTDRSRGFWYMLQAVDYLVIAENGSYVALSASIPYRKRRLDTTIGFLVPKFRVDSGGVLG